MLHIMLESPLQRGDEGAAVALLRHHLRVSGFLTSEGTEPNSVKFDEELEEAVSAFQAAYSLSVDGRVDAETLSLVRTPRCGVPDLPGLTLEPRAYPACPWHRRDLRYHVAQTLPQIGADAHMAVFYYCLQESANATGISFTPGPLGSHIQSFNYRGDGPGGTYAYAYFPCAQAVAGDMHFDIYDAWSVRTPTPPNRVDFVSVCLHEMGHALGLGHSADRNSVMYAYFGFGEMRRRWTPDDLRGFAVLYPRLREALDMDAVHTDAPKTTEDLKL